MGGVATRKDWPRLANEVRTRRTELGLTQEDARAAGGPSTATMRLIEGALQDAYTPAILRRLEGAMRWRPGSVRDILAGGDPVPLDGAPSAPALAPAPVLPPDPVLGHILAAARRRPAPGAPSAVRAHLFAALAAVNAPLSAQVLAEAAAGRPFTDPVERAVWASPDWSDEEKAEEIASYRARRAEFGGQGAETG